MADSAISQRNNVQIRGQGEQTLVLAHGFGCDQNMWRFIVPLLEKHYRLVLFDYVGSGRSELAAFDIQRYSALTGYAQDLMEVCDALGLKQTVFVGHSVSGTIGMLAAQQRPELFAQLIMICPSPCFLNQGGYPGGFEREDLEDLLSLMDKNYIGWAHYLAPLVIGPQAPETLLGELSESFCSTDPLVAKTFARATFFSDHRDVMKEIATPVLLLQSGVDDLASPAVGRYMEAALAGSHYHELAAEGHCLHMTHPVEVADTIMNFLSAQDVA